MDIYGRWTVTALVRPCGQWYTIKKKLYCRFIASDVLEKIRGGELSLSVIHLGGINGSHPHFSQTYSLGRNQWESLIYHGICLPKHLPFTNNKGFTFDRDCNGFSVKLQGHLRLHHPSPFYQIFSAGLDLEFVADGLFPGAEGGLYFDDHTPHFIEVRGISRASIGFCSDNGRGFFTKKQHKPLHLCSKTTEGTNQQKSLSKTWKWDDLLLSGSTERRASNLKTTDGLLLLSSSIQDFEKIQDSKIRISKRPLGVCSEPRSGRGCHYQYRKRRGRDKKGRASFSKSNSMSLVTEHYLSLFYKVNSK
ncbi:uncharacterized protein LOC143883242 [Tasmannia lanceolata]|uniref:uncharacterized protein LOC143883242 n=1 Tax=Tasmannia lanceolata TaxID=3420 RepID=UPI00406317BA